MPKWRNLDVSVGKNHSLSVFDAPFALKIVKWRTLDVWIGKNVHLSASDASIAVKIVKCRTPDAKVGENDCLPASDASVAVKIAKWRTLDVQVGKNVYLSAFDASFTVKIVKYWILMAKCVKIASCRQATRRWPSFFYIAGLRSMFRFSFYKNLEVWVDKGAQNVFSMHNIYD